MNYDKDAERAMIKARILMLRKEPFFGSLALRMPLVESTTLQFDTLATDGESLFYSPKWVRESSADIRKSGIGHEVGHCMMQHLVRLAERNAEKWNRAGDYVINAMLKDAGFTIGDSWLYNPKYANLTTDAVYRMLPDQPSDYEKARVFDAMLPPSKTVPAAVAAQQWAVAVIQAANTARKAGRLPVSIERFVEEMLNGKADWGSLLRRFITERARNSFDWMRPSRKAVAAGVHLPGRYSEQMDTLVVVTDDSGSITAKVLAAFSAETAAARDAATPLQTYVLSCDARVNHVTVLEPDDPFVVKNHGGGGTDFRPPFAWLEERGIVPSCLVYLTDLEGRFPKHPPDYPVLWCSINSKVAPWGETIKVEV